MKEALGDKGTILLTAIAALAVVMLSFAIYGMWQDAEAVLGGEGNLNTVSSNKHNFAAGSGGVEATSESRICIFCHTPHNASLDSSLINGPLWNHTLSTKSFAGAKWTPGIYNQLPFSNDVGWVNTYSTQPNLPDGSSRMCLSCHDGTIGVGDILSGSDISMVSDTCIDSNGKITSGCTGNLLITDLQTKHIVSIPMNQYLIDNSTAACTDGSSTIGLTYPWTGSNPQGTTVLLRPTATTTFSNSGVSFSTPPNNKYRTGYNYGVQCSTCHDPHYWSGTANTVGYKFLVTSSQSALCKACHDNANCP